MCLIRRRILNALSEQPTRPETYFEMTKNVEQIDAVYFAHTLYKNLG